MAITGGVEFVEKEQDKSLKELLTEQNNVRDLNDKVLDLNTTTDINENEEAINAAAEKDFDKFILTNESTIKAFFKNGTYDTEGKSWIETNFRSFLDTPESQINTYLTQLKDIETASAIKDITFELENLSESIQLYFLKNNINTSNTTGSNSKESSTTTTKTKETRDEKNTYQYKPQKFSLTELGDKGKIDYDYGDIDDTQDNNTELLNIFKKGGLQKQIEKLLGGNLGGLEAKDFKIDLSPEHGLAGLILYVEKNNLRSTIDSGKDIKALAPDFAYTREGGLDNERGKLAEIIKAANNDDTFKEELLSFANEAKGYGSSYEKRFKQALNFADNLGSIDEKNILESLCDFNGDGKLAVDYTQYIKRKEHRNAWKKNNPDLAKQYNRRELRKKDRETEKEKNKGERKEDGIDNQGDVGTIFGPQLYDAVQTASNVAEVKIKYDTDRKKLKETYGDITGDNLVIYNILNNIRAFNTDKTLEDATNDKSIMKVIGTKEVTAADGTKSTTLDMANCTTTNLLKLCTDYPSFQPLFAKAIETMNGSDNILAPDLVNTLSGTVAIYASSSTETVTQNTATEVTTDTSDIFDAVLKDLNSRNKSTTPGSDVVQKFTAEYGDEGILQMKKGMMTMLDNVNISAMLNDQGKLLSLGIDKSWDIHKREHELKNSFAKTLIGALASVTFDPTTLSVGFKFGESNTTDNLKNKRSWMGDVSTYIGGKILQVSVGASEAVQFNYNHIITNSLDEDPASAKYVGVDIGASKIFVVGNKNLSVNILEGGINYQSDRKAAIEQMYKQYSKISELLFDLDTTKYGAATATDVDTQDHLSKFLETRYLALYKSLATSKEKSDITMAKFLDNNTSFLQTNIDQITNYFDKAGIFSAINASTADKVKATTAVLNIFQDGITNEWRETRYESIAGTTQLSKVGLGVGAMFIKGVKPLFYPTIALKFTHWRNNYINNVGQKKLDATLIGEGSIIPKIDTFTPEFADLSDDERITAYAEYIQAIYNLGTVKNADGTEKLDDNGKTIDVLETGKNAEGLLYLKYNGSAVTNITDIIDVRAKVKQTILDNIKISEDGKTLTLGDVGNITAYTQADGEGKRCFMVLGGTDMENTTRLTPSLHTKNTPEKMTFTKTSTYEIFDKDDIENKILSTFSATDKAEVIQFFAANGSIQKPILEGKTIVFNGITEKDTLKTGTLDVVKSADGKTYTLTLTASPADKFKINYTDLATAKEQRTENKKDFTTTDFFSAESYPELTGAKNIMETLKDKLMDLEWNASNSTNKDAYLKFMYYISNIDSSDTNALIDDKEITASIEALEGDTMLGGDEFKELLTLLTDSETTMLTKSWILDKLKTTFAEQANFDGKTLNEIALARGNMFATTLYGPSGKTFDKALQKELIKSKSDILSAHGKDDFNINPEARKNLIGYTAFYRPGYLVQNKNQRYSMTCLGETSAQTDPVDISIDNQSSARERFIENLKTNTYEMKLFRTIIQKQTGLDLTNVTDKQIGELLSGKELSIDNGSKISIKSKTVFYLAGQCANESLGLVIESLTVNSKTIVPSSTGEATSIQSVTASTAIAGKNLSSAMKVGSYGEELGVKASLIPTEKQDSDRTDPYNEPSDGDGDNTEPGIDTIKPTMIPGMHKGENKDTGGGDGQTPGIDTAP